jgi:hypothetical protein
MQFIDVSEFLANSVADAMSLPSENASSERLNEDVAFFLLPGAANRERFL